MRKNLKLGLFGFGCVGQGLYHVLHETKGVKAEIKRICVKTPDKPRPLAEDLFTFNREEILNDPEIDVVVELIDDASAAFEILKKSLENGKAVVTANKKMLSEHLEEVYELQQRYQKPVLYEGSVCGSIPIIRNLEEYYDNDLISSVEGIFNGSTNYILTKVFEERRSYQEALSQAQALGFAESDPSLDVKAYDPKFKLTILIAHAFGVFVRPEEVINIGIDRLSAVDLKYAKDHGLTIKLVARALKSGNKIFGLVAPQFVEKTHPLASVRNEFNAVTVEGAFAEKQLFVGKGAGSYPTGSAVLSDVSALTYDYQYEYKKRKQENRLTFSNDALVEVVVSFANDSGLVTTSDFEQFKGGFQSGGQQNMQGIVRLEILRKWSQLEGVNVILSQRAVLHPVLADPVEVLSYT
ncbi:MAG: homoserine dehydrogenase [Bacteroidetes bacterium]|nr:homoserine dehydrogenase [Bacteroidota bacterium]